jgi:hypothetical protein
MKQEWEILIKDEKEAAPYKEKLSEIAETLVKHTEGLKDNIGLMGGKIGVALFFLYFCKILSE